MPSVGERLQPLRPHHPHTHDMCVWPIWVVGLRNYVLVLFFVGVVGMVEGMCIHYDRGVKVCGEMVKL